MARTARGEARQIAANVADYVDMKGLWNYPGSGRFIR